MSFLFSVVGFSAELVMKVDINHADAEELATVLSGVGEKKAQAIIDYRATHDAFLVADDLAKVKGIGKKTVEKNRDKIVINPLKATTGTVVETPAPDVQKTVVENESVEKTSIIENETVEKKTAKETLVESVSETKTEIK